MHSTPGGTTSMHFKDKTRNMSICRELIPFSQLATQITLQEIQHKFKLNVNY